MTNKMDTNLAPSVTKSEESMVSDWACKDLHLEPTESRDEDDSIRASHAANVTGDSEMREGLAEERRVDEMDDDTGSVILFSSPGPRDPEQRFNIKLSPGHNRLWSSHFDGNGPSHDTDSESFNLLGHSFDIMSENEHFLQEIRRTSESSPPPNRETAFRHDTTPSAVGSISLPAFGSSSSCEDISPIKMFADHDQDLQNTEPLPFRYPKERYENQMVDDPRIYQSASHSPDEEPGACSNALHVLRCLRRPFSKCTFLLSHIKDASSVLRTSTGGRYEDRRRRSVQEFDPEDLLVATRRVKSAVCALGGNMNATDQSTGSIFRPRSGSRDQQWNEDSQLAYAHHLPRRFFMNESGAMSWEIEEYPPVESMTSTQNPHREAVRTTPTRGRPNRLEEFHSPDSGTVRVVSNGIDPPKMKYRCKLCGQPKQNHVCRYIRGVHRDIGIQVFPLATAHAAVEDQKPPSIQPDTEMTDVSSPKLSPYKAEAAAEITPNSASDMGEKQIVNRKRSHFEFSSTDSGKNARLRMTKTIAVKFQAVRTDQYRAVTPSVTPKRSDPTAYRYPTLPLTYGERKRLCDTLFVLSREIPDLMDECGCILRSAREADLWDLAVAELLTQLVVALYCSEFDTRLDGLQRYLSNLGISS